MNYFNPPALVTVIVLAMAQFAFAEQELAYKKSCLAACACFSTTTCSASCPKECSNDDCRTVTAAIDSLNSEAKLKLESYFENGSLQMNANATVTKQQYLSYESGKYDNFAGIAASSVGCSTFKKRNDVWEVHSVSARGLNCNTVGYCPKGGGSALTTCHYKCRPCDDVRAACDLFVGNAIADYDAVLSDSDIVLSDTLTDASFLNAVQHDLAQLRNQSVVAQGCLVDAASTAVRHAVALQTLLIAMAIAQMI